MGQIRYFLMFHEVRCVRTMLCLRLRSFRIRVMLQAAMSSSVDTTAPVAAAPAIPMLARVLKLRPGDSNLVSVLTDLREFLLTRMVSF